MQKWILSVQCFYILVSFVKVLDARVNLGSVLKVVYHQSVLREKLHVRGPVVSLDATKISKNFMHRTFLSARTQLVGVAITLQ